MTHVDQLTLNPRSQKAPDGHRAMDRYEKYFTMKLRELESRNVQMKLDLTSSRSANSVLGLTAKVWSRRLVGVRNTKARARSITCGPGSTSRWSHLAVAHLIRHPTCK